MKKLRVFNLNVYLSNVNCTLSCQMPFAADNWRHRLNFSRPSSQNTCNYANI